MDIKEIKELESPWEDLGLKVGLEKQACPLHGGRTLSVQVGDNKSIIWKCRNPTCAGHGGGTIVELSALISSQTWHEAAQRLLMEYGKMSEQEAVAIAGHSFHGTKGAKEASAGGSKLKPKGAKPPEPPTIYIDRYNRRQNTTIQEWKVGEDVFSESYLLEEASRSWVAAGSYNGRVWAIAVLRWDVTAPDGKPDKVIRPYTRNPEGVWVSGIKGIKVRPLFNLHEIERRPNAVVVVVEGEKCMGALERHFEELSWTSDSALDVIVTTSIGGSNGAEVTDWSPLNGRHVYIAPDCDGTGLHYAKAITACLNDTPVELIWVHPSREDGDGYDVADWTKDRAEAAEPGPGFWELPRQPLSWSSALMELRSKCDRSTVDGARALVMEIMAFKPDELVMEDLIARLSKATGLARRAIKAVIDGHRSEHAARGWPEYFARKVIEEEFGGWLLREAEQWWTYDGRKWVRLEFEEQIASTIHETMLRHWDTEVESWATTLKQTREILLAMTASKNVRLSLNSPPPAVFNCTNTELVIGPSGEVTKRQHAASHFLLHTTECEFDPEAECPRYDDTLNMLFREDPELIAFWHEFTGYLLQPQRDLKHFFLMQGSGNNGKTSIMRVLAELAGGAFVYKDINTLTRRFAYSSLVGRLALIDDDVAAGSKLPDGELKKLSWGNSTSVEFKGKTEVNMHIVAAPILLCNKWPSLSDITPATLERAIVIPFHASIPVERRNPRVIPEIIRHELPGVLNRSIDGLRRLRARGHFNPPRACRDLHRTWLSGSNHGVLWAATRVVAADGGHPNANDLYNDYTLWCVAEGIKEGQRYSKIALRSILEGLSHRVVETSAKYGRWRLVDAMLKNESESD